MKVRSSYVLRVCFINHLLPYVLSLRSQTLNFRALFEVHFTCRLIGAFILEQVAELIATCVSNLDLAEYKVLEAVAETTAPFRSIEDLLAEVPAVNEEEDDQEKTARESKEVSSSLRKNFKSSRQQEVHSLFLTLFVVAVYL